MLLQVIFKQIILDLKTLRYFYKKKIISRFQYHLKKFLTLIETFNILNDIIVKSTNNYVLYILASVCRCLVAIMKSMRSEKQRSYLCNAICD